MPYIDVTYYKTTYLGTDPQNDTIVNKAISRANDVIDTLTHYAMIDDRLPDYVAFSSQPTFVQNQVQKAVATLAEHWIILGGYDSVKQTEGLQQVYIGDFRIQQDSTKVEVIPESVIAMLSSTGLMYAGIDTSFDSGLYYTGWWI